ncbi:COG1470 family protein [Streptomyces sp. SYSU K21746]
MRVAVRAAVAAAVLLGVSVPGTAFAARGEPGWTARPAAGAGARPGGDARPYFYLEGAPGAVLEDELALSNPSDRARTVRLRGAGVWSAWIAFAADEVRVPPRTRADVPFTVTVPPGAVPGDHPGAVVAAADGREARVRVHLRVGGPALSALTVEDVAVTGRGGATVIRYAVVNRGNTALTPDLAVRADGVLGDVLRREARPLRVRLLPGQRLELTERWPDAPALDAVDVRLTVTAGGGAHGEATASARFVPWPQVWGAALGALLLGAAAPALRAVRGRRTGPPDEPATDEATGTERHLARAGVGS